MNYATYKYLRRQYHKSTARKDCPKNFTVLSDVNLNIKKGRFCYLIGKTGSGKSSLLKTLYGHIPLASGHGAVVGFDLAN
jgi:cell division transport system ATP-binding protein